MKNPKQQAILKKRIAIFGGAFDPVHRAHLELARAACRQASLDKVVFVPAAQSPLKPHGPRAGNEERLRMLQLAVEDEASFEVDDLELERGGISYTLDTVKLFKEKFPDAELFWILGGDQLARLDRWHAIRDLSGMITFLVMARPGYELSDPPVPGLKWIRLEAPLMEESSTSVRELIEMGKSPGHFLPERVEAFIREKGLYI